MNRIVETRTLAPEVKYFRVEAPRVARKRRAGQFVIIRVAETGERIPLTIADANPEAGWIALIVQGVGKTTRSLNLLKEGDSILDLAGPLGMPSEIESFGSVVVVGGGVGTAIIYPNAVALADAGNDVTAIIGGRSREFVILEDDLNSVCLNVYPTTDDGSYGFHGFVTEKLEEIIDAGGPVDRVLITDPKHLMAALRGEAGTWIVA